MIHFISHMSTSWTHSSLKGKWLSCERESSYGLLEAVLFFPSCSRRVLHFSAMDSHKEGCEFLPLPLQQKLSKLPHSVKWGWASGNLKYWLSSRSSFTASARPWPLSQSLPAFVFIGIAVVSPSGENLLLKIYFCITWKISRKAKCVKFCCFIPSEMLCFPHVSIFFLNDSILFTL